MHQYSSHEKPYKRVLWIEEVECGAAADQKEDIGNKSIDILRTLVLNNDGEV